MTREILIVDDDRLLLKTLEPLLAEAGYAVRTASNGEAAVTAVRERRPDLVLLDVMMPGKSGIDVCRELRTSDPSLVIVFLTALDTPEDELKALSAGGDVCISKSVPDELLLARIAAILRLRDEEDVSGGDFDFGLCRVESEKLLLSRPGRAPVALNDREVMFLRLLATHPGAVLNRDAIITRLWGADADDNQLYVLVHALRRKLGRSASAFVTIRGGGYSYRPCRA